MSTHIGSFTIDGEIEQKWIEFGGLTGPLSEPVSNVYISRIVTRGKIQTL
jgi:hypothetical protein